MGVHLASQSRVEELQPYVDRIDRALAEALGVEPGMIMTDESYVSDFLHWPTRRHVEKNKAILDKLSAALGVQVEKGDSIVALAERLRDA